MTEHHSSHSHGHHSLKYYENPEKYVYSEAELQAYRIPGKYRNKCVNLYVPLRECTKKVDIMRQMLDPKVGPCSKEMEAYNHCMDIYVKHTQNIQVYNCFYANAGKAKTDVISPSFEQSFFKTPLAFSW